MELLDRAGRQVVAENLLLGERISEAINELAESMLPALRAFGEGVQRSFPAPQPGPQHPMLAAIERRRTRNTGPEQRRRAPRKISPRH